MNVKALHVSMEEHVFNVPTAPFIKVTTHHCLQYFLKDLVLTMLVGKCQCNYTLFRNNAKFFHVTFFTCVLGMCVSVFLA